ncbi:outer membrane protein assembly factor BamE [Teichococcus vastitatis]|uniref:outer membrane protein assembly factor BamE n=1 Tax=Teichococcus vastitatis TaxID=2307076 RepID=UPI001EE3C5AC|nr:outer membrane protein assembly factor BamE [Pseudoroseomonas vastitatis]
MDRSPIRVNPVLGGRATSPFVPDGPPGGKLDLSFRISVHTVSFCQTPCRKTKPRHTRLRAGLMALAVALPLAGCSVFQARPVQHGNKADPDLLAQLVPGVQTQADVQALLGSPSVTGTFDPSTWYYISSVSRIQPGSNPSSEQERVVVMRFDEGGVLRNIEQRGPDTMRDVGMVDRTTPVPGTDRTLLQALFGNIGRVGAGGIGTEQGPGTGPGR